MGLEQTMRCVERAKQSLRREREFLRNTTLLVIANATDAMTSAALFEKKGTDWEANPIVSYWMQELGQPHGLLFTKVAYLSGVVALLYLYSKQETAAFPQISQPVLKIGASLGTLCSAASTYFYYAS